VRPCEAVQTVVVSERRWGDSSGLDCSAWIGVQLVEKRRMVEAKLMAVGWNLILLNVLRERWCCISNECSDVTMQMDRTTIV